MNRGLFRPPRGDVPAFRSEPVAFSVSTLYRFSHGLGRMPRDVRAIFRLTAASGSFAVGDEVIYSSSAQGSANTGIDIVRNATTVAVIVGSAGFVTASGVSLTGALLIIEAD